MQADEVRFIEGRVRFGDAKASAPFPSAVAVFRLHDRPRPIMSMMKQEAHYCPSADTIWLTGRGF